MNDYSHSSSAWRTAHARSKTLRLQGHLPPLYTKPQQVSSTQPGAEPIALAADLLRPPAPVIQEL